MTLLAICKLSRCPCLLRDDRRLVLQPVHRTCRTTKIISDKIIYYYYESSITSKQLVKQRRSERHDHD